MKRQFNMQLDDIDFERIEDLQKLTGRSKAQVIRDGVRLLWQVELDGQIGRAARRPSNTLIDELNKVRTKSNLPR